MTTSDYLATFRLPAILPEAHSSTVDDCRVIELPQVRNRAGNLTAIQPGTNYPFDVKRVYFLYDVPSGSSRGGHSHFKLTQLLVSASGSFDVHIDDGFKSRTIQLNRPNRGLIIFPGIWREIDNFSSGSICLVLASLPFDENDYTRSKSDFYATKKPPQTERHSPPADSQP